MSKNLLARGGLNLLAAAKTWRLRHRRTNGIWKTLPGVSDTHSSSAWSRKARATRVVVAHTADDQAETVLAHILRGTGPAGLAGIYPSVGSVVRPLLGERREDLREYLRGVGQDWREDSTNRDLSKQRARIREQLLPLLERDFSPRAVDHLAGLAELAREEEVFWNALVDDRFRALVRRRRRKTRSSHSRSACAAGFVVRRGTRRASHV